MDSELVQRIVIVVVVLVATYVAARLVDRLIARHFRLRPETLTVYRVVRRAALAVVIGVGVLSALLVIPEVRAVAASILASSAIVALVFGLAAQPTLSNFIAGIMIAFTQPLRLGDTVTVAGSVGVVQEIGLTYTTVRGRDGSRYYVPNSKLASDTIRNASIAGAAHLAAVTVPVPLTADLDRVLDLLRDEAERLPHTMTDKEPKAHVSQLEPTAAVVTVNAWARTAGDAEELASGLRLAAASRLRAEGILT